MKNNLVENLSKYVTILRIISFIKIIMRNSNKASHRKAAIGNLIRDFIALSIINEKLSFKDFDKMDVSIISCDISSDLKNAIIFISVSEKRSKNEIIKLFNSVQYKNAIKKMIAENLKLRFIPEISFKLDLQYNKTIQISELIDGIVLPNL